MIKKGKKPEVKKEVKKEEKEAKPEEKKNSMILIEKKQTINTQDEEHAKTIRYVEKIVPEIKKEKVNPEPIEKEVDEESKEDRRNRLKKEREIENARKKKEEEKQKKEKLKLEKEEKKRKEKEKEEKKRKEEKTKIMKFLNDVDLENPLLAKMPLTKINDMSLFAGLRELVDENETCELDNFKELMTDFNKLFENDKAEGRRNFKESIKKAQDLQKKQPTVILSCKKEYELKKLKEYITKEYEKHEQKEVSGAWAIKCPYFNTCHSILTEEEKLTCLGEDYKTKMKNYNVIPGEVSSYLCGFGCKTMSKKVLIHKNHILCEICLKNYIERNGGYVNIKCAEDKRYYFEPIKCPLNDCTYKFFPHDILDDKNMFENYLTRFISQNGLDGDVAKELRKHLTKGPSEPENSSRRFKCSGKCSKQILKEKAPYFKHCNKYFCKRDFFEYLDSEIEKKTGTDKLKCPCCLNSMLPEEKAKLIPVEKLKSLDENMYARYRSKCPKCSKEFSQGGKISRDAVCPFCNYEFCKLCKTPSHDGICINRKKMIEDFKNTEVMPCPYCLEFAGKDPSCSHVTCYYCKEQFSFCCSVSMSAVTAHGGHYHRPNCKEGGWREFNGVDICKPKECDMCFKNNGQLCKRPNPLEDNDIPQSDYPEQFRKSNAIEPPKQALN